MPRPPRADAAGEIYHALSLERVNRPVSEKEEEQIRWQTDYCSQFLSRGFSSQKGCYTLCRW